MKKMDDAARTDDSTERENKRLIKRQARSDRCRWDPRNNVVRNSLAALTFRFWDNQGQGVATHDNCSAALFHITSADSSL